MDLLKALFFCRSQILKKDIMFIEDLILIFLETKDEGGLSNKGNKDSNKKFTKKLKKYKIYKNNSNWMVIQNL